MSKRAAPRSPSSAPRLFEESAAPEPSRAGSHTFNIDGGSRGNPGPASYGVVVRDAGGTIVARLKKYIGRATNNVAEYYGLIAALDYAQARSLRAVRMESDSELLVKQMRGQYKVKSPDLRPLFEQARKMAQSFASFSITHVYREQNSEADALANQALDETGGAPAAAKLSPPRAAKPSPGRIRARYAGGVLIPREPLDLPEGSEVELQVYQQDKL
jgi:probable phosphoglycerate mutase